MAQVIIVSRTRMADGFVCVGGVDVDNRRSVRLLDARGRHETAETCPYTIWDIWDIDYYPNQRRPNPHTEDVNVMRRMKMDRVDAPNMSVNRFAELMLNSNIPIFRGSLFSVFDGKLRRTDNDKLYISKEDVPTFSTCFWINDMRLLGYKNDRGRWQYRYTDMSNRYGYTISYVGSAEPLDTIEPSSLVRLSLAHWWKPEDSDDEERCYLQLSGCLIEGKDERVSIEQHKDKAPLVKDDVSNPHNDWFDNLEQELDRLLLEKAGIEEKIADLRSRIIQQMTELHLDKYTSSKYTMPNSVIPSKECLQKKNESVFPAGVPTNYMERQKALYPDSYKPWSTDDDALLTKLYMEGTSIEELMSLFQRNRGGIASRLRKLGLT